MSIIKKPLRCKLRCHLMAPNNPARKIQQWDSYLMETPARMGRTVMAKNRLESILFLLLTRYDAVSIYAHLPVFRPE